MRLPRFALALMAALLLGVTPLPSHADSYTWSGDFAGVGLNNYVNCVTEFGTNLIVGGSFDHAGPVRAVNVARWDGTTWHPMGAPSWSETLALGTYDGEVYGHGFLGGALMKWDGAAWVAVGSIAFPGYNTNVRALLEYQGKLVVGGDNLLEIDGHFALFTYDGSVFGGMGNKPDLGSGLILDLVEYQGNLYATGNFEMTTDSILTSGVACYDGAVWTPVEGRSSGAGPLVEGIRSIGGWAGLGYALAVHNGKLVIAGDFDEAGDLPVSNIVAWDGTTQMWEDVGGGSPETTQNLASVGGVLFAGGNNATFGGAPIPNLAQWSGSTWSSVGGGVSAPVATLHDYGGQLVLGGQFKTAGGEQAEHIATWDGTAYQGMHIPGGKGLDDRVLDMTVHNGGLIAAGHFEHAGAQAVKFVGQWDGMQWSDLDGGANEHINCVISDAGDLIVGGAFTEIGGTPANYVARWDGTSWHAFGTGPPDEVTAMCMHNGDLHVGGNIVFDGYVRRWDGASWQTIALEQYNTHVDAMTSYGGELIVASGFWDFPQALAYVARRSGSGWLPLLSTHGSIEETVYRFYHYNGELYMGGVFAHLGGSHPNILWTAMRTGRWNGTSLQTLQPSTLTYPPGATNGVGLNAARAFAEYDGRLFIAGTPDYRKGAIWSSDMVNPWEIAGNDVNHEIHAMVPYMGQLYIGGRFTEVGCSRNEVTGTVSAGFGAMGGGVIGIGPPGSATELSLDQNHPNPFNPSTTIQYVVPAGAGHVSLVVYDVTGRVVRTLWSGAHTAGPATASWDGTNDEGRPVASGLYLYRIVAGSNAVTKKMVLVK